MIQDEEQQVVAEVDVVDDGATRTSSQGGADGGRNLETILRIPVTVQVVLGSASMPVSNLLRLGRGAVIPLDHRVGEPVDVMVNGRVVARGEVVVVEDDNSRFGVSLTEVVGPSSVID
jgi:flagellar motor switch protein FliN/FliY